MQANSWKPLPLRGHLCDHKGSFLFCHAHSLFCDFCVSMSRNLLKHLLCFFLFFSFSWLYVFSFVLFSLFNTITLGALQIALIKINGNTWRNVYSQIPRIPGEWGHSVSVVCCSWLSLQEKMEVQPHATKESKWADVWWAICGSGLLTLKQTIILVHHCNHVFSGSIYFRSKDLNAKCH